MLKRYQKRLDRLERLLAKKSAQPNSNTPNNGKVYQPYSWGLPANTFFTMPGNPGFHPTKNGQQDNPKTQMSVISKKNPAKLKTVEIPENLSDHEPEKGENKINVCIPKQHSIHPSQAEIDANLAQLFLDIMKYEPWNLERIIQTIEVSDPEVRIRMSKVLGRLK